MATDRLGPLRRVYPTDGAMQIPVLRRDRLAGDWPDDVQCVGYTQIADLEGSALVHYTDDFRFASAWSKPELYARRLLKSGADFVVEPDESVYANDPWPEKLHAVYRARWCARHWQEAGILVAPSLSWDEADPAGSVAWTCAGIPVGPPLAVVEARPRSTRSEVYRQGLAAALRVVRPQRLLLYGSRPDWLDDALHEAKTEIRWCRAWTPHWRRLGTAGSLCD